MSETLSRQQSERVRRAMRKHSLPARDALRAITLVVASSGQEVDADTGLDPSHTAHPETLFRELAEILCPKDVIAWNTITGGFSWVSLKQRRSYAFSVKAQPEGDRWHFGTTNMSPAEKPARSYQRSPIPPPTVREAISPPTKREAIGKALDRHTLHADGSPNSTRSKEQTINALLRASATGAGQAHEIYINDSHITLSGRRAHHREALFRELAEILCPGDVTEWASHQSGAPTRPYQDALSFEFSWVARRQARRYRFFTKATDPAPGFSIIIDWFLSIETDASTDAKLRALHARLHALEQMAGPLL